MSVSCRISILVSVSSPERGFFLFFTCTRAATGYANVIDTAVVEEPLSAFVVLRHHNGSLRFGDPVLQLNHVDV